MIKSSNPLYVIIKLISRSQHNIPRAMQRFGGYVFKAIRHKPMKQKLSALFKRVLILLELS